MQTRHEPGDIEILGVFSITTLVSFNKNRDGNKTRHNPCRRILLLTHAVYYGTFAVSSGGGRICVTTTGNFGLPCEWKSESMTLGSGHGSATRRGYFSGARPQLNAMTVRVMPP
ncbi:hypothetical protein BDB00DRAFT_15702 [Zychaea mexicana]|uniref:uncharacterized protein n=1 Tax=Zychaea mexicana TaxID=64656 RepID=UPI0022FDCE40|nr:uncharacterized protein BDB00DRAFT_15702 [Zychaea mexicana]KAI9499743.1 hypothetical protein BDB00DRAFT_15702 [Zychaea mexicana]